MKKDNQKINCYVILIVNIWIPEVYLGTCTVPRSKSFRKATRKRQQTYLVMSYLSFHIVCIFRELRKDLQEIMWNLRNLASKTQESNGPTSLPRCWHLWPLRWQHWNLSGDAGCQMGLLTVLKESRPPSSTSQVLENNRKHLKTYVAHFIYCPIFCEYFTHLRVCVHSDASKMQRQWKISEPDLSETTTLDAPWLLAKFKTCNASTVCCCKEEFTNSFWSFISF